MDVIRAFPPFPDRPSAHRPCSKIKTPRDVDVDCIGPLEVLEKGGGVLPSL